MEYNSSVNLNTCNRKLLRFWWPDYEMQLLEELQKQQNSAQFCDTLLQTEGISVPTHSCVLAAFSPYLSQKLSASPAPPSGQKRQLQLGAVTAQTLLKLIGLLYSGELEVKGAKEQSDVIAAAHQFGITGLVVGHKDGGRKKGELLDRSIGSFKETGAPKGEGRERHGKLKMQDAQVQAEMTEQRNDFLEIKRSVSKGTQTVKTGEMSEDTSGFLADQIAPPERVFSAPLQPPNITLDKQFCLTPCPTIPSDGESTAGQLSSCAKIPTSSSALSSDTPSCPVLVSEDPSSPITQEENLSQQSPRSGDSLWVSTNKSQEQEDDGEESEGHEEQLRQASRDEMLRGEKGNSEERRRSHAKAGMKNLAKMLRMETMETTQISIKVKLKRRTKGEMWEVVSLQDTNEAFSVFPSLKKDCSSQKASQTELKDVQTPPETQNSEPINVTSPKTPNHSSSSLDPSSSGSLTLNQSKELESSSLPQLQGSVEESDEQMERWLEDIMMGLNILSNLDSNCTKSQLNHDGAPTFSQAPVAESGAGQSNAVVGAAGCLFYQDLGTQSGRSSADTGIHYCLGTQSHPTCSSLSSVLPDALMQQRSQLFSSLRSSGRITGMSCLGLPPSKNDNSLCPETVPAGSVLPFPSSLSGPKLHYSALQQLSSLKDQTVEFVPFSHESETQSEHTMHASLPCMDEMRLPQRLSPLEPYTGEAQDQLLSNSSANPENDIQKQKSLFRRPWLTETPMSLQFPLRAIIGSQTVAPPQDVNNGCETLAECCPMNSVTEKERELTTELVSDPKNLKESLSCKQHDAKKDAAAPKRRRRRARFPQDGDGFTLPSKKSKVSDGRTTHCVVSLSSKNILVKEREMAASPSNEISTSLEKTKDVSTITETLREKTRCPNNPSTEQTRIRTRGFVKRSQEKTGNTINKVPHVLLPVVRRTVVLNKQGGMLLKRKRGRPRKIKLEERLSNDVPVRAETGNHNEADEQVNKDLPKVEKDEKTKTEGRKRRRKRTRAEGVPLKKSTSADCSSKTEGDNNNTKNLGTSSQSWTVTLKEFKKLIKRRHSKTRKSKESHETNEPARDLESEENAKGCNDSAMEVGVDVDIAENAKSQDQGFFNDAMDGNYNQVSNTAAAQCSKTPPDDSDSTASEETRTLSHEDPPEVAKLSTEQLLKNSDEGAFCDHRRSDTMQSASRDEDASLDNSHVLQENVTLSSVPESSPPIPEKSDPPLPGADGIKSISECSQEEEEEEVDVVIFSPEKKLLSKDYEDGLNNMVLTPDEEEEEEVNEIDVTGDETE